MKIARKLTPYQVLRFKIMCLVTICGVALFTTGNFIANAVAETEELTQADAIKGFEYKSGYQWQGQAYTQFERTELYGGYIDEYTNKETFCTSWVLIPGTSL